MQFSTYIFELTKKSNTWSDIDRGTNKWLTRACAASPASPVVHRSQLTVALSWNRRRFRGINALGSDVDWGGAVSKCGPEVTLHVRDLLFLDPRALQRGHRSPLYRGKHARHGHHLVRLGILRFCGRLRQSSGLNVGRAEGAKVCCRLERGEVGVGEAG